MLPHETGQFAQFLIDRGFTFIAEAKTAAFGDSDSEFHGARCSFRIVSDRGQCFVDAAPAGKSEWFDVALLAQVLNGRGPDIMSFVEQAEFVCGELSGIESLLSSADGLSRLLKARSDRVRRRMPGLFG